ncbi:DUF4129 domain-containing protein [Phycicoccus sp. 3266]|uniref:DUF4129 domain-containing protein n=1 Tax=Phycicoccus sp. 3266 TaxID=2817751 RepID=UPI0028597482|nr:DUF4129 domain-containing protein [Phycicoccus sp. 3266]MDR6861855.1 hypothetical protein [Phycicoccus sp. 3266]
MNRKAWALLGGAGVTLLLAAWVSAAGPVGVFARQDFSGPGTSAPGEEYASGALQGTVKQLGSKGRTAPQSSAVAEVVAWSVKVVLVLVVLAVLVAIGRAVLAQLRTTARADDGPSTTAEVAPDVMLAAVREGEELLATGTPANAVVAAWVALEEAARSAGIGDDRSRTSEELVGTVLRRLDVDAGALDRLGALYREARFSRHEIGEDLRTQAREALRQVQADISRGRPPRPARERMAGARR